jgi:hypothetical protein
MILVVVAQEVESSFMGGWSRSVAPYAHLVGMGEPPVANSPCDLDDGGGGGGGGRIKLFFDAIAFTGNISVVGGFGARTAEPGEDGSIFPVELQPQLVNNQVTFEPLRATFTFTPDPMGCPEGFVGKFSFEATLSNTSNAPLASLAVHVTTLTDGNLLQNADEGPRGAGARLTVSKRDDLSDGLLSPEEFVDVPFILCLTARQPFTFIVDVLGVVEE